jgi:hypothetical protein
MLLARPDIPRPHTAIVPDTFVLVHIGTSRSRPRFGTKLWALETPKGETPYPDVASGDRVPRPDLGPPPNYL